MWVRVWLLGGGPAGAEGADPVTQDVNSKRSARRVKEKSSPKAKCADKASEDSLDTCSLEGLTVQEPLGGGVRAEGPSGEEGDTSLTCGW